MPPEYYVYVQLGIIKVYMRDKFRSVSWELFRTASSRMHNEASAKVRGFETDVIIGQEYWDVFEREASHKCRISSVFFSGIPRLVRRQLLLRSLRLFGHHVTKIFQYSEEY